MKRNEQGAPDMGATGLSGSFGDDIGAAQWERWQDSFLAPLFETPEADAGSTDLAPSSKMAQDLADGSLDGPEGGLFQTASFQSGQAGIDAALSNAAPVTLTVAHDGDGSGVMTAQAEAAMNDAAMDDGSMDDTMDHDTMDHGSMDTGTMDDTMDHGSMDGGSMDDTMDHGSMDMGGMIMPPVVGATLAQIDAYVEAVMALADGHPHPDDSGKMTEHLAAMDLVERSEATHVAISDGDWFDTATWHNGRIPDEGAKVLIPEGIDVTYAGVDDTSLFTVRVDGRLSFDTETDSRMVFDTVVVSPTGSLVIGTESDPIHDDVSVELIVANNGPIDTAWDPMLLSRGVIAHGSASIHGMEKDSHDKVVDDPMAGDTELSFAEIPEGWQVGDTLVIAGTRFEGHGWSHAEQAVVAFPPEDEVRKITAIKGNTIVLDSALEHDHDTPRDDLKTSVANMSRNVTFQTENGSEAEVYERGHVMFMHSDDVDVRYAAFKDLGRTDKSEDSFDISDFEDVQYDSNVQGRYSLHLHRTGTGDIDNPAQVVGNAVWGSPGWGFVQHDSNAVLDNNASFDTFGAGFVAETGNETGVWNDNVAIYAEGMSWGVSKVSTKLGNEVFDTARGGDGFWFQGRLIETTNNIAASVNSGFVYFHRDGDNRMILNDADHFDLTEALLYKELVSADEISIQSFSGNETFAANRGLEIVKSDPNQGHDVWSELDTFTAWSVVTGAHLEYTAHYILRDFDVVSKEPSHEKAIGIILGRNTGEIVLIDSSIDGFSTGINFLKEWVNAGDQSLSHGYAVIDTVISNATTDYGTFDPSQDRVLTSDDLPYNDPNLSLDVLHYENQKVIITGTKSDSMGEVDFPAGTETFQMRNSQVVKALETDGYWTTSAGLTYFLIDIYFTDRVTGEFYYETHPVFFDDATAKKLGQQWWEFHDAVDNGIQDFEEVSGLLVAGEHILDSAIAVEAVGRPAPAPLPETGTTAGDTLTGGVSDDIFRGLAGEDEIQGGGGNDRLFAGRDNDVVWGQGGDDHLKGQGGNDKLYGGAGNDLMLGHGGQDKLFGGNGNDLLFGNRHQDKLVGHNGNDTLSGGFGKDVVTGGDGNDIFHFDNRHGKDTITDFTVGEDMILLDYEGANYDDLRIMATNDGTRIFTEQGSITLIGVTPDDLSVSDFMFTNGDYWG